MKRHGWAARVALLTVVASLGGCAESPPPAAPVAPPPPPPRDFTEQSWSELVDEQYGLVVPVPEGPSWRKTSSPRAAWPTYSHTETHSTLALRRWIVGRYPTRDECLAMASHAPVPLPPTSGPTLLAEPATLELAGGYRGTLWVSATGNQQESTGQALLVAAAPRRCLVALFQTTAAGTKAEAVLGTRLALIAERSLPRVRELSPEERVERAPRPSDEPRPATTSP